MDVQDKPWGEIEDIMTPNAHPFAQITRIGERDAACHDSGFHLSLCGDIPGARDNHLVRRTNLTPNKLYFICD